MHRNVHGRMNDRRLAQRLLPRVGGSVVNGILGLALLTGCGDAVIPGQPIAKHEAAPPALLILAGDEQLLAGSFADEQCVAVDQSDELGLVGYPVVRAAKPPGQFAAAPAAPLPTTSAPSSKTSNDGEVTKSIADPSIQIKLNDGGTTADTKSNSRGVVRAARPTIASVKQEAPKAAGTKVVETPADDLPKPPQLPRRTMTAVTIVPAPTPVTKPLDVKPALPSKPVESTAQAESSKPVESTNSSPQPAEVAEPAASPTSEPSLKPAATSNQSKPIVRAARRPAETVHAETGHAKSDEPASSPATETVAAKTKEVVPETSAKVAAATKAPADEAAELIVRAIEAAGSGAVAHKPVSQPVVRMAKSLQPQLPAEVTAPAVVESENFPLATVKQAMTKNPSVFAAPQLPATGEAAPADVPLVATKQAIAPRSVSGNTVDATAQPQASFLPTVVQSPVSIAPRSATLDSRAESSSALIVPQQKTSQKQAAPTNAPTVMPPAAPKVVVDKATVAPLAPTPVTEPVQPLVVKAAPEKKAAVPEPTVKETTAPLAVQSQPMPSARSVTEPSIAKESNIAPSVNVPAVEATPTVARLIVAAPAATPSLPAKPVAAEPAAAPSHADIQSAMVQTPAVSSAPEIATPNYRATLPKIFAGRPAADKSTIAPRRWNDLAIADQTQPDAKPTLAPRPTSEQVSKAPRPEPAASPLRTDAKSRPSIDPAPLAVDRSKTGAAPTASVRSIASRSPRADRSELPTRKQEAPPSSKESTPTRGSVVEGNQPARIETSPAPASIARLLPTPQSNNPTGSAPVVVPAARPNAATLLPTAAAPPPRSPQMNVVALEAARHVRTGFGLAERGAYFAARSEFVQSLRLLSQALDVQNRTARHSQSLAAGMRALDEAEDFAPRGSRLEADLDLPMLIAGHRTPVLKEANVKELSPLIAQQRYYSYAQEQLGIAAAGEPAGSMALHGLGKFHGVIASQPAPSIFAAEPKALVYQQAALLTDSRNYLAANELAVLLAKNGYLQSARTLLQRSVAGSPQPTAWHNLSVVHRYLGEKQLSALAEQESAAAAERLASKNNGATSQQIRWVDPQTFAASSRTATDVTTNPVSATAAEMPTGLAPPLSQPAPAPRSDVKAAAASTSAFKPFWQRKQE